MTNINARPIFYVNTTPPSAEQAEAYLTKLINKYRDNLNKG